jgi:ribosomal-protein-serine acetyltransferase
MFSQKIDDGLEIAILEPYMAKDLYLLVTNNLERLKPYFAFANEPVTLESTRQYILYYLDGLKTGENETFGIFYEGKLAGEIGFGYILQEHKKATFIYWIGKEFEGKGIVSRCARFLIDRAFSIHGMNRVSILADSSNYNSRKVAERLGLKYEGVERGAEKIGEHFNNLAMYSVLKDEWQLWARLG